LLLRQICPEYWRSCNRLTEKTRLIKFFVDLAPEQFKPLTAT